MLTVRANLLKGSGTRTALDAPLSDQLDWVPPLGFVGAATGQLSVRNSLDNATSIELYHQVRNGMAGYADWWGNSFEQWAGIEHAGNASQFLQWASFRRSPGGSAYGGYSNVFGYYYTGGWLDFGSGQGYRQWYNNDTWMFSRSFLFLGQEIGGNHPGISSLGTPPGTIPRRDPILVPDSLPDFDHEALGKHSLTGFVPLSNGRDIDEFTAIQGGRKGDTSN